MPTDFSCASSYAPTAGVDESTISVTGRTEDFELALEAPCFGITIFSVVLQINLSVHATSRVQT